MYIINFLLTLMLSTHHTFNSSAELLSTSSNGSGLIFDHCPLMASGIVYCTGIEWLVRLQKESNLAHLYAKMFLYFCIQIFQPVINPLLWIDSRICLLTVSQAVISDTLDLDLDKHWISLKLMDFSFSVLL